MCFSISINQPDNNIDMRNLIFLILLFIFNSCVNQTAKQNSRSIDSIVAVKNGVKSCNDTLDFDSKNSKLSSCTYYFANDTLIQKIVVKNISDTKISFVLMSENIKRELSDTLKGIAISKSDFDPEIDEDEDGNAYPAQEYIFDGKYRMSIRIDMEDKDKLRVVTSDNVPSKHKEYYPLRSIGILHRIENE